MKDADCVKEQETVLSVLIEVRDLLRAVVSGSQTMAVHLESTSEEVDRTLGRGEK